MKITFRNIWHGGFPVLIPCVDGKPLPSRSVVINEGWQDVPTVTVEIVLEHGVVIEGGEEE